MAYVLLMATFPLYSQNCAQAKFVILYIKILLQINSSNSKQNLEIFLHESLVFHTMHLLFCKVILALFSSRLLKNIIVLYKIYVCLFINELGVFICQYFVSKYIKHRFLGQIFNKPEPFWQFPRFF